MVLETLKSFEILYNYWNDFDGARLENDSKMIAFLFEPCPPLN
jgi:hypothetical protein